MHTHKLNDQKLKHEEKHGAVDQTVESRQHAGRSKKIRLMVKMKDDDEGERKRKA